MDVEALRNWTYQVVTPRVRKVEIAGDLVDALMEACCTALDPRKHACALLGVPLRVSGDLPPLGWRALSEFDEVVAQGVCA